MEQKKLSTLLIFITPQIIRLIMNDYEIDEEKATEMFYSSKLYAALEKDETKLWHLSGAALFEMFQEEQQTGIINYPEEA